ncbi:hypothetical protein KUTeg_001737 [Tegillarca granosa]|uniref:Uncharacterized protein n=1 Tax=Tegillarca granosa TaxID=220873 RepID=A0ABQ9FSE4_TEGGR|nr:hypothetical protein KUTeg_001737 [Tegillarca granosa]
MEIKEEYNSPLRLGRTFYRSYILIYQCQHRKISHLRMDKLYAGTQEEQAPVDGVVKGKIPEWISGSLFRNGPAMYEVGGQKYLHLFDGLAAIQKFEIKNGKATYSRKFVKSEAYKKNMAANKIVVSEFGTRAYYTDPCKTFFQRFFAKFVPDEPTDNTSVSVWPLKDRLFASTETNVIHEIDPENLDTIDRMDIRNYLTVDSATAHPHWEPDGTVHNIGYMYGKNPSYCLMRIPAKEGGQNSVSDIKLIASIPSRWKFNPGYYHSFAVTENYYVFLEQPLCINIIKILTMKLRGISFSECINWYPNEKTLLHIIDKSTGEKVNRSYTYQSDGFFVFHHANAYEQDGQIVLDVCAYADGSVMKTLSLEKLRKDYADNMEFVEDVQLKRFVLPLSIDKNVENKQNLVKLENSEATAVLTSDTTIECKGETIIDKKVEFPQVNYNKYNGKKYRYLYGIIIKGIFDTVVKVDMENKTYKVWTEEDCYASEPIFVANPDGQDEDDGVILTAVNSLKEGKFAFVLVLDAKTFTEKARVEFPDIFFPQTFHGIFRNS